MVVKGDSLVRKTLKKESCSNIVHSLPKKKKKKKKKKKNIKLCGTNTNKPVKSCPSYDTDTFSKKGPRQFPSTRKVKTFQKKLGSIEKQSRDSAMGIWPKNRFPDRTHPRQTSTSDKNVNTGFSSHKSGSDNHVGERCHSKMFSQKGTISEQSVSSFKKGWGQQTSDKPKMLKCFYSLSALQNGRFAFTERSLETKRLSLQDRFKRRLLLRSVASKPSKVYSVSMGWPTVRIPLFMFWSRTSPTYFHETVENPNSCSEKNQRSDYHLSGRHVVNESNSRGHVCSQGYVDFSITALRFHNKPEEVSLVPNPEAGVFGDGGGLCKHDHNFTRRKSGKVNSDMQIFDFEPRNNTLGTYQPDRFTLLNSTGSDTRIFANKIPSTTTATTFKSTMFLPVYDISQSGSNSGTSLVGKQFKAFQREVSVDPSFQNSDSNRCIQEGMGCILSHSLNRGSMDSRGVKTAYLCVRTESNTSTFINVFKDVSIETSTLSSGQHDSPFIFVKNGGNSQQGDDSHIQGIMELCHIQRDHNYCRVPSREPQYPSGLGIKTFPGFKRMAISSHSISENNQGLGDPADRSFCFKGVSSTTNLHGLEAGSSESGHRCFSTAVEKPRFSLCFPTFLSDRKSSFEGLGGKGNNDIDNPKLAGSTVVQSNTGHVHSGATTTSSESKFISQTPGASTSLGSKQNPEVTGMESIRKTLVAEGISERAAGLITSARRCGTTSNYQSSWRKWVSWCSEQQVVPITCHLNYVLDFLAYLYDMKYEYSTINSHRSAISAYHEFVDNQSVGQHPKVCKLLTGVFNKNPPKPRYTFIWDVEQVLDYIKSLPGNTELSNRLLLLKLTMLLFLTSAGRCHEICYLDIPYMIRTSSSIKFYFSKITKSWKKGKAPPSLEIKGFPIDKGLCVVSCIEEYLIRSESWRTKGQCQLLLSHLKPHKEVQKSTISGWVKLVLKLAGIDISLFKAHSCRSGSTSKAKVMGLSMEAVLKRGQWSGKSTWQKHYFNPIEDKEPCFESTILKCTNALN